MHGRRERNRSEVNCGAGCLSGNSRRENLKRTDR